MILEAASTRRSDSFVAQRRSAPGWRSATILLLTLMTSALRAQEEAGVEEGRKVHLLALGVEAWVAQPAGLEYTPATVRTIDTNFFSSIDTPLGTETELRYTAAFELPESQGAIQGAYYHHSTSTEMAQFEPGRFLFGEALAFPFFAGALDDGTADGFSSTTTTSLRDWQITYGRPAFRTPKVAGDWSIGWRRVDHRRFHQANYFATVSPLPPPPAPTTGLEPRADFAEVRSEADGRGLTGGLDLEFNLWRDRLVFESSFGLAVLRADLEASSTSITHLYECGIAPANSTPQVCIEGDILGVDVPFDILGQSVTTPTGTVAVASFIDQVFVPISVSTAKQATSLVTDLSAGFRWRALNWLDARVGFRQSRYTDVGLDVAPTENITQEWTEIARDATYEGFFLGVVFHVY